MPRRARARLAAAFLAALLAACGGGSGAKQSSSLGTCQGGTFTGGNPAGDDDGDGISNAAECAAGTNPNLADTDGDGVADGAEVAAGTNPLVADTDGDGLSDGAEAARGTNPLLADTDGDGLRDAAEVAAGTSPLLADTDADGLSDAAEAGYRTNPLLADTDGDRILDGDEVALGLDPTVPDPPTPAVCNVLSTCARDALVPVRWEDRLQGDYRVALPEAAVVGEVTFLDVAPPGRASAAGFDLAADAVAGFVLSMDEVVANGDPTAQLNALATRLSAASGSAAAPWSSTELIAGRAVTTWDGYPAVVGARVNLVGASDARAVRLAALAALLGANANTFTGLPAGAAFGADASFVLSLEVVSRRSAAGDAHRVVVVAAVAPKTSFDAKAQPTRIAVSDLTGGTALGQSGDGEDARCDGMPVTSDPKADFVWMSDVSGSTADERTPIQNSTSVVFDRLVALGIDFRMAVVRHTANHVTNEEPAGRLVSPGFTTDAATFRGYWGDPGADQGLEYGLTAIDDVVGPSGTAVPRTATPQATKVREGVKLVVIYVSDEHAQEVEYRTTAPAGGCPGVTDATKEDLLPTERACVEAKVQPFIDHLAAEDAIAFGIIAEPPTGCATSQEVGWGYSQVIAARGGTYGSVCASDPGQTLDDIVTAVAGAASSFVLTGSPIAMTLKVVVTPAAVTTCDPAHPSAGQREVARSQVDGFDYDPVNNTLYFVGPSRPAAGDTVTVSYREWVDRTSNPNPDPPVCTDCGGCAAGTYCEPVTCTCTAIAG